MRKITLIALVSIFLALPVMAAAQSHGHSGSSHADKGMNKDAHGDAVSAEAKNAKQGGGKVGPNVSDVAQDKAHGKGLTKSHSKPGH
jgi:uncharacterized low-complexity protein